MSIKKLTLFQFKNYESLELEFKTHVICFLGNNGQGKTNLLDAVHYLSFCKSYFNSIDSQNIKSGEDQGSIYGEFHLKNTLEIIHCGLRKNQRKVFKRNHKEYDKLSEHIGLIPSVILTPYDIELILDGSEIRRKFIDATISQYSNVYLDNVIAYNQALAQRNNLLKSFGKSGSYIAELLEPWDYQLVQFGQQIFEKRKQFFAEFIPVFNEMYHQISGGIEVASLEYKSDLHQDAFEVLLKKNKDKDRFLERTAGGIHKDDMEFSIDNFPIKKYASQGQQKSFLIALKLAQYQILKNSNQETPILLLDDIYDKVDDTRVANLIQWLLKHHDGQIFISDTHVERIPAILKANNATFEAFRIEKGSAIAL